MGVVVVGVVVVPLLLVDDGETHNGIHLLRLLGRLWISTGSNSSERFNVAQAILFPCHCYSLAREKTPNKPIFIFKSFFIVKSLSQFFFLRVSAQIPLYARYTIMCPFVALQQ